MANKKKVTKTKKKKKQNKKLILIITIALIILMLVIAISVCIVNGKKLTCTKLVSENGFKIESKVDFKLVNKKIESINLSRTISVMEQNTQVNYLSMIKSSMQDVYKNEGVNYSTNLDDNKLTVNLLYTKQKKYIIDNIFIEKEDDGISFNVIKEDTNGNYATFDLSKNYDKDSIIRILKKANYTCK